MNVLLPRHWWTELHAEVWRDGELYAGVWKLITPLELCTVGFWSEVQQDMVRYSPVLTEVDLSEVVWYCVPQK